MPEIVLFGALYSLGESTLVRGVIYRHHLFDLILHLRLSTEEVDAKNQLKFMSSCLATDTSIINLSILGDDRHKNPFVIELCTRNQLLTHLKHKIIITTINSTYPSTIL